MWNNNGMCGNNICWIILLLVLFCGCGCGNNNSNSCDNNCGCC